MAEANKDELIFIERNWYFPPERVNQDFLRKSDTPYTCPWKGECQYYDVGHEGQWSKDSAWTYPEPLASAIQKVHKDFSGFIAFWRGCKWWNSCCRNNASTSSGQGLCCSKWQRTA